jgi:hypothetical protein
MIKVKKKFCNGCNELQVIWKSEGKAKYCKQCWSRHAQSKSGTLQKRVMLSPRSSKQQKKEAAYLILRKSFLRDHSMCQAHLSGCGTYSSEVHHKKGRGEFFLDSTTWLAVCRPCHQYIETHPIEAKEMGFSVERLKQEDDEKEKNNQND